MLIATCILLYECIILLLHKTGLFTLDEWFEKIEKCAAAVRRTWTRLAELLKRHKKEIWSAVFSALKCIRKFFAEFGRYLHGEDTQEYMENASLILTDEDAIELSKRLDGHPYEAPTFCNFLKSSGIVRYEYRACGLAGKYGSLDADGIFRVSFHQIRNYMIETRMAQPYIRVEVATPTRLFFAIALSEHGQAILEKQGNVSSLQEKSPAAALEEEVTDIREDGE